MADRRVEPVMGTAVRVDVRDERVPAGALDGVFAWLREVDARFSTYRAGSDISRGVLDHPDVREVLARCDALRDATGGAFDARAGGRLDPSGYVKGWAVDRAGALLDAAGVERWCIGAGGDLLVRGGPWRVGVQHPHRRDRLAAVLELTDAAVATSGTSERGPHVADPRTGRAASGAVSVTIVGPELGTADAYATAALALGGDGPAWTATLPGHEALTVLDGGRVLTTRRFARYLAGGATVSGSLPG